MKLIIKLLYVQYIGIRTFISDSWGLLKSLKECIEINLDEVIKEYEKRKDKWLLNFMGNKACINFKAT